MPIVMNPSPSPLALSGGGGVTAAAPATLFTIAGILGQLGIGTIKNTHGSNTMTVRESVTDAFGTTTTKDTDVAPGDYLLIGPQVSIDTGRPPYTSYAVAVLDKSAGSHATYSYEFSSVS